MTVGIAHPVIMSAMSDLSVRELLEILAGVIVSFSPAHDSKTLIRSGLLFRRGSRAAVATHAPVEQGY